MINTWANLSSYGVLWDQTPIQSTELSALLEMQLFRAIEWNNYMKSNEMCPFSCKFASRIILKLMLYVSGYIYLYIYMLAPLSSLGVVFFSLTVLFLPLRSWSKWNLMVGIFGGVKPCVNICRNELSYQFIIDYETQRRLSAD